MSDRMEAEMQILLESHMRDMGSFSQSPRDVSSGTGLIPDDVNFDPITSPPIVHHSARF
ncbi:hypothetical protein M6B38_110890 [Iris pallida]|nr:hypothetical protein M6B38_110890 [Iris pallida]